MKSGFSIPGFLWISLTMICLGLIVYGIKFALSKTNWDKQRQRRILTFTILAMGLWVGLLSVLSLSGFFADFTKMPPRPAIALLIPLPVILLLSFSKTGTQLLRSVPQHWIVYLQSFRIAVELMLLAAFLNGQLPVQMTFEGQNFDVFSGLLALPVGYLVARKKAYSAKLIIAYNIIGMLLLLNILVIAVLSMPTPFRYFMNEPSNTIVAEFPFILLPGVLVPVAYSLHIFSLRQVLAKRKDGEVVLRTTI